MNRNPPEGELSARAGELGRAHGRAAALRLFAGQDAGFYRKALRGLSGEDPAALRAIAPRTGLARTEIYDLFGDIVPYDTAKAFQDSYEQAHWAEAAAAVSRAAPGQGPGGTCVLVTGDMRAVEEALAAVQAAADPGLGQENALRLLRSDTRPGLPGPGLRNQAEEHLRAVLGYDAAPELPASDSGFGFVTLSRGTSSALRTVTALLAAAPAPPVVLDQPEAGLDPRSQSAAGRHAALAAAAGRHAVLGTHSDHVFNAVRAAVAEGDLPAGAVRVRHFTRGPAGTVAEDNPGIRPDGTLTAWPPGLFDQLDHDLAQLARARRAPRGRGTAPETAP